MSYTDFIERPAAPDSDLAATLAELRAWQDSGMKLEELTAAALLRIARALEKNTEPKP